VLSAEDPAEVRRWISVIQATPSVLRAVVGGIQLKSQPVIAEFFGSRLGLAGDALVPTMLAAAAGGVIQAAHTQWFFFGGDLATNVSDGLEVVESVLGGDLATWSQEAGSAGA
jgi:TetR/AcrR family transcriptional regulator, regulator of mycofactocin system